MREILGLPAGLGQLKPGENTAELRFTNTDGETEAWILRLNDGSPLMANLAAAAIVWKAYIDDNVDSRLGNQLASINRLMSHLNYHHEEQRVRTAEDCKVLAGEVKL